MPSVALRALSVLLLVWCAGCRSVAVDSTHDPAFDFSKARTYDWLSLPPVPTSADQDTTALGVLTSILGQKGLQRSKEKPDLLIAVQRSIQGSLNTQGSGYEWRDGRLRRYTLQEGSLVIDMIDPATKESVWRGSASGAFRSDFLPEERKQFLTEVLGDLFEDFPPAR